MLEGPAEVNMLPTVVTLSIFQLPILRSKREGAGEHAAHVGGGTGVPARDISVEVGPNIGI